MPQIPSGTKFIGIGASVPTPENKSSQNNGFQEVYTLEDLQENVLDLTTPPDEGDVLTYTSGAPAWVPAAGGSDYTETIVSIPSAANGAVTYSDGRPNATGGILGIGTSPIELLPAPGSGKYYDIDKIVLEYTKGTTPYSQLTPNILWIDPFFTGIDNLLNNIATFLTLIFRPGASYTLPTTSDVVVNEYLPINKAINLSTWSSADPTLGDGTLRVKIYHKTITFGA